MTAIWVKVTSKKSAVKSVRVTSPLGFRQFWLGLVAGVGIAEVGIAVYVPGMHTPWHTTYFDSPIVALNSPATYRKVQPTLSISNNWRQSCCIGFWSLIRQWNRQIYLTPHRPGWCKLTCAESHREKIRDINWTFSFHNGKSVPLLAPPLAKIGGARAPPDYMVPAPMYSLTVYK